MRWVGLALWFVLVLGSVVLPLVTGQFLAAAVGGVFVLATGWFVVRAFRRPSARRLRRQGQQRERERQAAVAYAERLRREAALERERRLRRGA